MIQLVSPTHVLYKLDADESPSLVSELTGLPISVDAKTSNITIGKNTVTFKDGYALIKVGKGVVATNTLPTELVSKVMPEKLPTSSSTPPPRDFLKALTQFEADINTWINNLSKGKHGLDDHSAIKFLQIMGKKIAELKKNAPICPGTR